MEIDPQVAPDKYVHSLVTTTATMVMMMMMMMMMMMIGDGDDDDDDDDDIGYDDNDDDQDCTICFTPALKQRIKLDVFLTKYFKIIAKRKIKRMTKVEININFKLKTSAIELFSWKIPRRRPPERFHFEV